MANYKFNLAERHAVYTVHKEKCYLCNGMLDMQTIEVDHILPESLLDDPPKLKSVLAEFGLNADFNLNSYANWKPACRKCNNQKRAKVFAPVPIVLIHLNEATSLAAEAAELEQEVIKQKEIQKALVTLVKAEEQRQLTEENKSFLKPLFDFQVEHRQEELQNEPVRFTPLYHVVSDNGQIQMVRGLYGFGVRPSTAFAHPSFDCPYCGAGAAFNGTRCVRCGQHSDGD